MTNDPKAKFPHCPRCGSSAWFCTVCSSSDAGKVKELEAKITEQAARIVELEKEVQRLVR